MKLVKGQTFKAYLEQICTHYRLDGVNSFDEKKACVPASTSCSKSAMRSNMRTAATSCIAT